MSLLATITDWAWVGGLFGQDVPDSDEKLAGNGDEGDALGLVAAEPGKFRFPITHVETTPATTTDEAIVETIHHGLAAKGLLPEEHFVDAGYTTVDNLRDAEQPYHVDLVGPVGGGKSWQTNADKGFDISCFGIDWENQVVTCPQGHQSQSWHLRRETYGHEYITARFAPSDCHACPHMTDCTHSKRGVRSLSFKLYQAGN